MKSINDIIKRLPASVQYFLREDHRSFQSVLMPILYRVLGAQLAKHCYVADYRNQQLKIVVDRAIYYSQIYYLLPELTKQLKTLTPYVDLQNIKCSVARDWANRQITLKQPLLKQAINGTNTNKYHSARTNIAPRSQSKLSPANEILWQQVLKNLKTKFSLTNKH